MENYTDINSKTFDRWVEKGIEWGIPITHDEFICAKNGKWNLTVTTTKSVPHPRSAHRRRPAVRYGQRLEFYC